MRRGDVVSRLSAALALAVVVGCGDSDGKHAGAGGTAGLDASAGNAGSVASGGSGTGATGASGSGGTSTTGGTTGSGGQPTTGGGGSIDLDGGFDASASIVSLSKVDVLLVVDNSRSMADKAELLRQAVPDLITELVDPASSIQDLHVGVITSSLGSLGTTVCDATEEQQDDRAHLLGTLPRASTLGLTDGFVRWDPSVDVSLVTSQIEDLVTLAGDVGCGFESTLEAMYRFVADPSPPAGIVLEPCSASNPNLCAHFTGTDDELLAERRAFFRPDSLVAIVVLTDENDCSMRPDNQFYYWGRNDIQLWRSSSVCATNPNDPCCYTCGVTPPSGCEPDPICASSPYLTSAEDPINLRCFEQKRRFGIESLYPTARYVNALTQPKLCTTRTDLDSARCSTKADGGTSAMVNNPLYEGEGDAGIVRQASMVQFLGIVGVPWQNVAASVGADGGALPADELRFRTAQDLEGAGVWPVILGDPRSSPPAAPLEPLMNESITPRSGVTTTTGEPLAAPTGDYMANSINGHEWNSSGVDLQYACIYPIATPRDCSVVAYTTGCDCDPTTYATDLNPLCQTPVGVYGTIQFAAKAYPGLRHLDVMRGLGPNAIVASICARNVTDPTMSDFGFRPAIATALEQWKARLR